MAKKKKSKKQPQKNQRQLRRVRRQQIIFGIIATLIILSFILPSLMR